jgi:hypothetical protein
MKLRIVFYDNEWKRPAFLEIKRRVAEVICKDRAMISREGVRQILSGGVAAPAPILRIVRDWFRASDARMWRRIFWRFANLSQATGAIFVSYYREIWEAPNDDELRVTFDRYIHGSRYNGSGALEVPKRGWRPYLPPYLAPFPRTV